MADTTTIRINRKIYLELKKIADTENVTIQNVMEKAIEEYKTKKFFCLLSESVARYKTKRDDWQEEVEERKLWDNSLADGLEDDDNEPW